MTRDPRRPVCVPASNRGGARAHRVCSSASHKLRSIRIDNRSSRFSLIGILYCFFPPLRLGRTMSNTPVRSCLPAGPYDRIRRLGIACRGDGKPGRRDGRLGFHTFAKVQQPPFGFLPRRWRRRSSERTASAFAWPGDHSSILEDLRLGRAPAGRFLLGGVAALILHLAAVEAHDRSWSRGSLNLSKTTRAPFGLPSGRAINAK